MPPPSLPLDQPATIPVLRRLVVAKVISVDEGVVLEQRIRRSLPWMVWLDRGLLILGVALIVSGVGYFFAHNWAHLTDADKLVLAGGAVLAALVGATRLGFDVFPGKLLLLAASVLVGIFIFVFGTIYQSTAEATSVFAFWAVLIFPWVALGRFPALWLFWMALLDVALLFHWQNLISSWDADPNPLQRQALLSVLLFNVAALGFRELAQRFGVAWMDRGWTALLLLTAVYLMATAQVILEILSSFESGHSVATAALALLIYAALVGVTYWQYACVRPSLPALAIATFGACVTLTTLAGRLIFDDVRGEPIGEMLIMGLITLAIFGGGVFILRHLGREFTGRQGRAL